MNEWNELTTRKRFNTTKGRNDMRSESLVFSYSLLEPCSYTMRKRNSTRRREEAKNLPNKELLINGDLKIRMYGSQKITLILGVRH